MTSPLQPANRRPRTSAAAEEGRKGMPATRASRPKTGERGHILCHTSIGRASDCRIVGAFAAVLLLAADVISQRQYSDPARNLRAATADRTRRPGASAGGGGGRPVMGERGPGGGIHGRASGSTRPASAGRKEGHHSAAGRFIPATPPSVPRETLRCAPASGNGSPPRRPPERAPRPRRRLRVGKRRAATAMAACSLWLLRMAAAA